MTRRSLGVKLRSWSVIAKALKHSKSDTVLASNLSAIPVVSKLSSLVLHNIVAWKVIFTHGNDCFFGCISNIHPAVYGVLDQTKIRIKMLLYPLFLACSWRHHFLKSKTKEPLMFLSSLDMRGGKFISVYPFSAEKPAFSGKQRSYGGAWHKATNTFVKKTYSYLVIFSYFGS